MADYLLDSNILLRIDDALADHSPVARGAFRSLIAEGQNCLITPQVIGEYFSVATWSVSSNGLGWEFKKGQVERDQWLSRCALIPETNEIFPIWLRLIDEYRVTGRKIFDYRLIAVMLTFQVTHLLTFNTKDFPSIPGIVIVHPGELAS